MTDPAVEHAKVRAQVPLRPRGNWTDGPCFYVTVVDGPKWAPLAGPFRTREEAVARVEECRELALKVDLWSHFYWFGTAKMQDGHVEGRFNKELGV